MSASGGEFLIWKSGGRSYGLEIGHCREVVRGLHVTPLPGSPHYVGGLVNLRGSVVVVFDLDVLLAYEKEKTVRENVSIIRIRTHGYPLAFIADHVVDVTHVPASQIETAPSNLSEAESAIIQAIAKTPDGLVLVPNIETITEKFLTNKRSSNA